MTTAITAIQPAAPAVEPVDAEIVNPPPPPSDLLTRNAGVASLANLSDAEFEQRLGQLGTFRNRIERVVQSVMVEGLDYGRIPGIDRPTLLKPGAERLAEIFQLVATYQVEDLGQPNDPRQPPVRYRVRALIHLGSETGPVVAEGLGTGSSWEDKHRWRTVSPACPQCKVEAIRKSKFDDGGFYCFNKIGGCGAKFRGDDPAIVNQATGRKENPNQYDAENAILKITKKRAYIDGMLTATGTSGRFTQDLDDMKLPEQGDPAKAGAASATRAQQPAAQRATVVHLPPPGPAHPPAQGRSADDPHPSLPCPLPDDKTGEPGLVFVGNDFEPRCKVHKWKLKERQGQRGSFYSCGKKESDKWCGAIIDGERLRRFISGIAAAPARPAAPPPAPSLPETNFDDMDPADFADPGEPPPNFDDGDDQDFASGEAAPPARGPGGPVSNLSPLQQTLAAVRSCTTKAAAERAARDGYPGLSAPGREELRRALADHVKTI